MNLRSVAVSAPGKVILHGEHAVVFGKKAVAAAIGLQTTVELEARHDEMITLQLLNFETTWSWKTNDLHEILRKCPDLQNSNSGKGADAPCSATEDVQCFSIPVDLGKAEGINKKHIEDSLRVFLFLVGGIMKNWKRLPSLSLKVNSSIPIGAGLGSSAAYCVSLSAALLVSTGVIPCPSAQSSIHGPRAVDFQMPTSTETAESVQLVASDLELICRWGLEGEKLLHGRPSGIDNSISTYGGILAFKDGNIQHLTRVHKFRILVIHTKVPRSTKAMVSGVRERYQEIPAVYNHMFEAIGAVAEESCVRLEKIDQARVAEDAERHFSVLEKLIDINQQLLAILGVSHSSLDEVCHVTRQHGLHSKLTGGGGGGCAFTLLKVGISDKSVSDVISELRSLGYEVWDTYLGNQGVTLLASL